MRRFDPRWLVVFLANLLLWWLVGVLNNYVGPYAFHFYVGGLFVTFAALRLDRKNGVIAIVLTGLTIDAAEPVPFGVSVVLLGLVYLTLLNGRHRFPREGAVFGTVVALLANLFLVVALSFILIGRNPRPGAAWLRIMVDLVCSQFLIALVTPWFLALQEQALEKVRIHPETGRRPVT